MSRQVCLPASHGSRAPREITSQVILFFLNDDLNLPEQIFTKNASRKE
jgi:hypothetical protein